MFIFNDTATAEFYTYRHPLPLHGALPISPVAAYVAVSGVGHLVLADDDEVALSNLQRQILHTTDRVGWPKAESGKHMLAALNPQIHIEALVQRLDDEPLAEQVGLADLVPSGRASCRESVCT